MNKKLEYLKKVAKPIKSKVSLAQMSDLASLIDDAKYVNTQQLYGYADDALTQFENAFDSVKKVAQDLISAREELEEYTYYENELLSKAQETLDEILIQLENLGVERSPELDSMESELSELWNTNDFLIDDYFNDSSGRYTKPANFADDIINTDIY